MPSGSNDQNPHQRPPNEYPVIRVRRDLALLETKYGYLFLEMLPTETLAYIVEEKEVKVKKPRRHCYIASIKRQVSGLRELLRYKSIQRQELERFGTTFLGIRDWDGRSRTGVIDDIHDAVVDKADRDF